MEINFLPDSTAYTVNTPIGLLQGRVQTGNCVSVGTPTERGKDTYITIRGVNYRFSFTLDSYGTGGSFSSIYREGYYISGATPKAGELIWKIAREVNKAVRSHARYAEVQEIARVEDIQREISRYEGDIARLQEKIEKLQEKL